MENNMKNTIIDLMNKLESINYVRSDSVPNIDLYMDQVTSFLEDQLAVSTRREEDKLLTKTMINNYTKNDLLPPPNKKKYSKDHMLTLLLIYYFKNILSISDIHAILDPITQSYFGNKNGFNMEDVYNEIFTIEQEESKKLLKDFSKKYQVSKTSFSEFPEEDQEFLHTFAFICQLSYDVYIKKMLIQKIIDDVISEDTANNNTSASTKKNSQND